MIHSSQKPVGQQIHLMNQKTPFAVRIQEEAKNPNLDRIQTELANQNINPALLEAVSEAREHLKKLLFMEESMLKQKARDKHLNLGDTNSKYFYYLVKSNKKEPTLVLLRT